MNLLPFEKKNLFMLSTGAAAKKVQNMDNKTDK